MSLARWVLVGVAMSVMVVLGGSAAAQTAWPPDFGPIDAKVTVDCNGSKSSFSTPVMAKNGVLTVQGENGLLKPQGDGAVATIKPYTYGISPGSRDMTMKSSGNTYGCKYSAKLAQAAPPATTEPVATAPVNDAAAQPAQAPPAVSGTPDSSSSGGSFVWIVALLILIALAIVGFVLFKNRGGDDDDEEEEESAPLIDVAAAPKKESQAGTPRSGLASEDIEEASDVVERNTKLPSLTGGAADLGEQTSAFPPPSSGPMTPDSVKNFETFPEAPKENPSDAEPEGDEVM